MNVRPTRLRTLIGHTKTLNHGVPQEISDFPKHDDDVFSLKEVACEWLCKYIIETRKTDYPEYIPHSLYLLLSGIQQYVYKIYPKMQFNLFADHKFTPLKNYCDSVFKKLHSKGIGASLKSIAVLYADDEKQYMQK